MLEISKNALQLLKVLAQNIDGNSRWVEGDFASIYEHPDPDIDVTIEELAKIEFIKPAEKPLGRRKTDSYEVTENGLEFLKAQS